MELQRSAEREILPRLTAEQRANLRRQLPLLLSFADDSSVNINENDDHGF